MRRWQALAVSQRADSDGGCDSGWGWSVVGVGVGERAMHSVSQRAATIPNGPCRFGARWGRATGRACFVCEREQRAVSVCSDSASIVGLGCSIETTAASMASPACAMPLGVVLAQPSKGMRRTSATRAQHLPFHPCVASASASPQRQPGPPIRTAHSLTRRNGCTLLLLSSAFLLSLSIHGLPVDVVPFSSCEVRRVAHSSIHVLRDPWIAALAPQPTT